MRTNTYAKLEMVYKRHKGYMRTQELFDDIIHTSEDDDMEFWYVRELQPLLGYSRWETFELVIKKAIISCENAGECRGSLSWRHENGRYRKDKS